MIWVSVELLNSELWELRFESFVAVVRRCELRGKEPRPVSQSVNVRVGQPSRARSDAWARLARKAARADVWVFLKAVFGLLILASFLLVLIARLCRSAAWTFEIRELLFKAQ